MVIIILFVFPMVVTILRADGDGAGTQHPDPVSIVLVNVLECALHMFVVISVLVTRGWLTAACLFLPIRVSILLYATGKLRDSCLITCPACCNCVVCAPVNTSETRLPDGLHRKVSTRMDILLLMVATLAFSSNGKLTLLEVLAVLF